MKRLLAVLLCVSVVLGSVQAALAQSGATGSDRGTPVHRVFLPSVSGASFTGGSQSAEELIRLLNTRYASSGVEFFVLSPIDDGVLRAMGTDVATATFRETDLLSFRDEQELYRFLDSVFLSPSVQAGDSNVSSAQSVTQQGGVAAPSGLISAWATVRWYQFACGGGAYYLGGVFCWKNITYTYQIDDVQRRVLSPSVVGSYLSGVNFLHWTHLGGTAYMINSSAARVNAFGYYTMGIQAFGLTIGASWGDSWSRLVYPPCVFCR